MLSGIADSWMASPRSTRADEASLPCLGCCLMTDSKLCIVSVRGKAGSATEYSPKGRLATKDPVRIRTLHTLGAMELDNLKSENNLFPGIILIFDSNSSF